MKHLLRFSLFEEVNPRDISFVTQMDDYFTVAFEFEIETVDKKNIKIDFSILYDDDDVIDMLDIIIKEMNLRKKSEKKLVEDIIYSVIDVLEEGIITKKLKTNYKIIDEMLFDIFNPDNFKSSRDAEIASFTKSILMSHIFSEDLSYMKKQAKKYLPNFTRKWARKIDYVGDVTLERGIEIKPKKYLIGLSEGIEMINDFFTDFESQDYWKFTDRTGLHINIGVNKKNVEWNPIKGLLMLNDVGKDDSVPLVFKDMNWRMNNKFCGSLITSIRKIDPSKIDDIKKSINMNDINSTEDFFNKFLTDKIKEWGYKNFGFNITKLDHNYVEFRYVGGVISRELLINKLKYFSFIVYAMTNKDYKRREYLKKLYKFVDSL